MRPICQGSHILFKLNIITENQVFVFSYRLSPASWQCPKTPNSINWSLRAKSEIEAFALGHYMSSQNWKEKKKKEGKIPLGKRHQELVSWVGGRCVWDRAQSWEPEIQSSSPWIGYLKCICKSLARKKGEKAVALKQSPGLQKQQVTGEERLGAIFIKVQVTTLS